MLSAAVSGLRCYTCWGANPGTCNEVWDCPHGYDRCSTTILAENMVDKQCMRSVMCNIETSVGIRCCAEDLCNGAKRAAVSMLVLLAPLITPILFI
ncbi:uncharacterized protein ACBR49_020582 [Aulostomus maculatus]